MKSILICVTLFLLSQWPDTAEASRIVVLFPVCTKSHIIAFMPIAETLAEKGHQVTIVSPFKVNKRNLDNIHEIIVKDTWKSEETDWFGSKPGNSLKLYNVLKIFRSHTVEGYKNLMASNEFQSIVQNRAADLFIVDTVLNEFVLPIVDHLKVPFIFYSPPSGTIWTIEAMSVSQEYAYVPGGFDDSDSHMTFTRRMFNMIGVETFHLIRKYFVFWMLDDLISKDFPGSRSISEIEREAQLCIVNAHPATVRKHGFIPHFLIYAYFDYLYATGLDPTAAPTRGQSRRAARPTG